MKEEDQDGPGCYLDWLRVSYGVEQGLRSLGCKGAPHPQSGAPCQELVSAMLPGLQEEAYYISIDLF